MTLTLIGSNVLSQVNIIPLQATKPAMQDDTPKKEIANPRLPTEVMYAQAESGSTITFDYITLLLVASVMAGVGLVRDCKTASLTHITFLIYYACRL